MGFPVDAPYQVCLSGGPIRADLPNAIQSGVTGVVGGSRTLTRLHVDGQGNNGTSAASGSLLVTSGTVIAPTIQASGTVLANLHASTAGGTGLELRSGAAVYAYHTIGTVQISGSTASGVIAIPVTSGKTVSFVARGVGVRSNYSGTRIQTFTASFTNIAGTGSLQTVQGDTLLASGSYPATQPGGILSNALSGAVHVQATGGSGQINWTVYADVTVSP